VVGASRKFTDDGDDAEYVERLAAMRMMDNDAWHCRISRQAAALAQFFRCMFSPVCGQGVGVLFADSN
jgi:hypothetical protein